MVIGHITQSSCGIPPHLSTEAARKNTTGARHTGVCRGRRPGGVACAHKRPPLSSCDRGGIVLVCTYDRNGFPTLACYALHRKALNV